jgi:hypothetical protein
MSRPREAQQVVFIANGSFEPKTVPLSKLFPCRVRPREHTKLHAVAVALSLDLIMSLEITMSFERKTKENLLNCLLRSVS